MIAFTFPWILGAALAAALAVTVFHLLSVRRPPERDLPTARFLPDREIRAVSRTKRPSDVVLLMLRIGALLAAGLAASQPVWRTNAPSTMTLVVASSAAVVDSAAVRQLVGGTTADAPLDMVFASTDNPAALFPLAWRAANRLMSQRSGIDSIDLHLLLPHASGGATSGWRAWRASWPGRVVVHELAVDNPSTTPARGIVVLAGDSAGNSAGARVNDDDAVRVALAFHAKRIASYEQVTANGVSADTVIVLRDASSTPPSASRIVVRWPSTGVPSGWNATTGNVRIDSVSALASADRALVGRWHVSAVLQSSVTQDTASKAIAWWSDGRVAALEHRTSTACVRDVAVTVNNASDLLLSPQANGLFDQLLAPCVRSASVAVSALTSQSIDGAALASTAALRDVVSREGIRTVSSTSMLVTALLVLSLVLLAVEWMLRRQSHTQAPSHVA